MPTWTRSTRRSSSATTRKLRGRPVIVGAGVVLAASYEAKAFGVRSAMGGRQARELCPQAIVVPPRFEAYVEASRAVFAIFDDTTPLVEGISIDEAFLDVGGLRPGERHAGRDRGPAAGRGARPGRARHHGRGGPHQVPGQGGERGREARRPALRPARGRARLPAPAAGAEALGRGQGDDGEAARARRVHRRRGGRSWSNARSCRCSGRGRDGTCTPWPTTATRGRSPSGGGVALSARSARWARRRRPPAEIDATLVALVDRVCGRLRKAERVCRTVVVRVRFDDFTRATRSHTLLRATWDTAPVLATARALARVHRRRWSASAV